VETLGAARLAKEIPAQRAVATIVPREEITAVLQDPDADPELYLRISGEGFRESDDSNVIAMSWSRAELEQLLEQATGDQIVLTFDREELAGALGDVEAHGMRERALVFAVAAAGALGTGVGIANAMPSAGEGGPAITSVAVPGADATVTDASSGAGYAAPAASAGADSIVTDASSGAGYAAPAASAGADSIVSDAASGAGYTAPVAAQDEMLTDASSAAGYTAATDASASDAIVSDAASGAGYAAPVEAQDAMLTDASSAAGYTAAAEGSAGDTLRTDASLSAGYGTVDSGSSGSLFTVHAPSTTDGLLAGGILLAITGATFASRRRTGTIRPA
jgi:hypothetical protein